MNAIIYEEPLISYANVTISGCIPAEELKFVMNHLPDKVRGEGINNFLSFLRGGGGW